MIEIVGQAIDFQGGGPLGGALVYAPGQTIAASTVVLPDPRASVPPVPGSGVILLENGAVVDVSGIPDTQVSATYNLLTTSLDGNALADLLNSKETGLRIVGRSQGFYGAVERLNLSLGALSRLTNYEAQRPGRKLLVWFSSGWPMLSGPRVEVTQKNQEWLFNTIVALSRTLRETRWVLAGPNGAAARLGMKRTTLQSRMQKLGIHRPS